jgi:hypothetical protein
VTYLSLIKAYASAYVCLVTLAYATYYITDVCATQAQIHLVAKKASFLPQFLFIFNYPLSSTFWKELGLAPNHVSKPSFKFAIKFVAWEGEDG